MFRRFIRNSVATVPFHKIEFLINSKRSLLFHHQSLNMVIGVDLRATVTQIFLKSVFPLNTSKVWGVLRNNINLKVSSLYTFYG